MLVTPLTVIHWNKRLDEERADALIRIRELDGRPTLRVLTAKYSNHVWHLDTTTIPTSAGLWTSWAPFAFLQSWPFCWWVAVLVDHDSRWVMRVAVFQTEPSAFDIPRLPRRRFAPSLAMNSRWRGTPFSTGIRRTRHAPAKDTPTEA